MSIQILSNIKVFLHRVTATGPECSEWHAAIQYVESELKRLQDAEIAKQIEAGVKAALTELEKHV